MLIAFFSILKPVNAAVPPQISDYTIHQFSSNIQINQDTSLTVTERIEAEFVRPKHGIFRVIPVVYSARGKTIRAKLEILSVSDESDNPYQYETSRLKQSIKIKIGNPNKTISGPKTYLIKYKISKILLRYPEHEELYWNVTGHEWDTRIDYAAVTINSPYATITKTNCFAGRFGSQEKFCLADFTANRADAKTITPLNPGDDFTIAVALNKNNQLKFPGLIQRIITFLTDNWGYSAALFPLIIMLFFWYKKGRDQRYLTDNIYYRPEDQKTRAVFLFEREHLPLVYSPLKGLTPAQVGTIIDERVDIQDVVAEIVELARLGFLKISKIKKNEYRLEKTGKKPAGLKNYQLYLRESLFKKKDNVLLSELKNKFYRHLSKFKNKLYQSLVEEKIFPANPEKTKNAWLGIAIFIIVGGIFLTTVAAVISFNSAPLFLAVLVVLPALIISRAMSRRTAWGHALYRQISGLRWYLDKGKWREEIAEKHLFLEEVLPLAIALGTVKKLAKEMAALKIKPPSYLEGMTSSTLGYDLGHFSRLAATRLVAAPSSRSSWSGGSGFSGSSGGGFGGGGGGSW